MSSSTSSSRSHAVILLGAFAATLILLVGASEWLVRTQARPLDTFTTHVKIFTGAHSGYAAFGDSHVARDFAASAPVENLAYPSENIDQMAFKLTRYLARNPSPRGVLLQADPHLFADYRLDAGLQDYASAFDRKSPILASLTSQYRPQLLRLWQSFFRHGGKLTSQFEMTPQGAILSPGDLSTWQDARLAAFLKTRLAIQQPNARFEDTTAAGAYAHMVRDIAARGADVCLVRFPLSPAYRTAFAALSDADRDVWGRVDGFYRQLAEETGATYLDLSNAYDDARLFRDPDHLNRAGALAFGPVLQQACGFPGDAGA